MFFNLRTALAEIEKQAPTPATSATPATQHAQTPPNVADVADVAAPQPETEETGVGRGLPPEVKELRHGFAVNGGPKTWTGKVVSLVAWRQLNEWERHGPNGRHWNGKTQAWEATGGGSNMP
jgi:hypothetical protein